MRNSKGWSSEAWNCPRMGAVLSMLIYVLLLLQAAVRVVKPYELGDAFKRVGRQTPSTYACRGSLANCLRPDGVSGSDGQSRCLHIMAAAKAMSTHAYTRQQC
jgi:hypothetical protein